MMPVDDPNGLEAVRMAYELLIERQVHLEDELNIMRRQIAEMRKAHNGLAGKVRRWAATVITLIDNIDAGAE